MSLFCLLWELTGNNFSPGSSGDDGDLSQKSLLHTSRHLTLHLAAGGMRLHLPDIRKKSVWFGFRGTGKNFERGGHKRVPQTKTTNIQTASRRKPRCCSHVPPAQGSVESPELPEGRRWLTQPSQRGCLGRPLRSQPYNQRQA